MKKTVVFIWCVFGSILLSIQLATCRKVSGEFYVVKGLRICGWHRCRELTDAKIWLYKQPDQGALITLDNVENLTITNVDIGVIGSRAFY